MIITKAPLRVSFFGGGTDLPLFYKKYSGHVISAAIKKYVYVTIKTQEKYFNEKFRLNYFNSEKVKSIDQIKNGIIREALKKYKIKDNLYISTISDIPSGSGLGSSSAFCVALLKNLNILRNNKANQYEIAKLACNIELNKLKKPIGIQDQFATALGGVNYFKFKKNYSPLVKKINLNNKFKIGLEKNCVLIWTGIVRNADKILSNQNYNLNKNLDFYKELNNLTQSSLEIFDQNDFNQKLFSFYLNENWKLKKFFSKKIINSRIKNIFEIIENYKDCGAKLCGAGNGGFILLCYDNKKNLQKILHQLKNPLNFNLEIEDDGVQNFL